MTVVRTTRTLRRAAVRLRGRLDVASVMTLYVFLLVAVPSRFVIGPLGGAGTPSLILGVACLVWWIWFRLRGCASLVPSPAPIRAAAGFVAAAVAASYVAACVRPTAAGELSLATLSLINAAGWLGVLLVSHDGLISRERTEVLLGRLVFAGTALAGLGLLQFATGRSWIDQVTFPGLTMNSVAYGTQMREGFTRPLGTAIHPLEFGAVLAMTLPLAVAWSATSRSANAVRRWAPSVLIVLAVALSNSRSTFVCAGVGLVAVVFRLDGKARRLALGMLALTGIGVFVLVPGMLGSILGLFTGIGSDSSSRSRFDSYSVAVAYAEHSFSFGRGLGTFVPRYRIFDNEYLLLFVEIGVLGIVSVLALVGSAIWVGVRGSREADDRQNGLTIQGLAAGVAAGAVSLALFDAFSFPMVPGLLFLLIGLVGSSRVMGDTSLRFGSSGAVEDRAAYLTRGGGGRVQDQGR